MNRPLRTAGNRAVSLLLPILLAAGVINAQQDANSAPAAASANSSDPPGASLPNAANSSSSTSAVQPNQKPTQGPPSGRLFYALPNFLTVENAGNVPPLTTAEKFKLTARDSFDPVQFLWYGALAGIAQADNSERVFGQGAEGYAKRYGVRFADGTLENFMTHPIFGSIFHQDPRYYQLGKGGFLHRTLYAASRVFITRSDSGAKQFNISEVLGAGVGAGISTYTWHPKEDRSVHDVFSVWGAQVGQDAIGFVAKEFWPDIHRKIHEWRTSKSAQVH
jgi:hypothetical protein